MERARVASPVLRLGVAEHEGRLRISVSDNGVGIPAENLTRIFNHGFTTKRDGHGFGLHSSANAATELHGRLWAESAGEGRGSTFTIDLPLDAVPKAA
jgi:signal transduction histidine kinase